MENNEFEISGNKYFKLDDPLHMTMDRHQYSFMASMT